MTTEEKKMVPGKGSNWEIFLLTFTLQMFLLIKILLRKVKSDDELLKGSTEIYLLLLDSVHCQWLTWFA